MVKRTPARPAGESAAPDPAAGWSTGLKIATGGQGVVAHAGVVLPRRLADRIGLTAGLRAVVARRDFSPRRDRAGCWLTRSPRWSPGPPTCRMWRR